MIPFSFSRSNPIDIPVGITPPEEQMMTCSICGFSSLIEDQMRFHIHDKHIFELVKTLPDGPNFVRSVMKL